MSEPNLEAMTQAELLKYLEEDFMPRLLPKLANLSDHAAENARLKAEVERLRKAGDAMAKELPMIADTHLSDEVWVRIQSDWQRAKEGKQS